MTSSVSYILLLLRWHGQTNVWESLYIFPGGLGTGAVQTGVFVAVQAATDPTHKAAALGGVWLTVMVGAIVGMTAVSTATMHFMASSLSTTLQGRGFAKGVIEKVRQNRQFDDQRYTNVTRSLIGPLRISTTLTKRIQLLHRLLWMHMYTVYLPAISFLSHSQLLPCFRLP